MLEARLNSNTPILICNEWSDLTIEKGVALYEIASRFPDNVKRLYGYYLETQTDEIVQQMREIEESISDEQRIKILPSLYGEVMQLLTDIESSIINQLLPIQRTNFYQKYLAKFVIGILHFPVDFSIKKIENFELHGEVYYLPNTHKFNIGNISIEQPLSECSTIEFTEAADLELAAKQLKGGRIEILPNIIAILCRQKGEAYDERIALERAKLFMQELTMDVAWEVFFCLVERFNTLKKRSQIFLLLKELKEETILNSNNLVGTLKSLALQNQQRK